MKEILNTMLSALTRGEGVMLCSILKADGSSPRGAGNGVRTKRVC